MSLLRVGTRASRLATTQADWVAGRLRAAGHEVTLVQIQTEADHSTQPLASMGGTGVFVGALRQAMLRDEVDLAVHSLKDLPVAAEPDLVVAAVPPREDPRDVVVTRDARVLGELPAGSLVGTGSPRRASQLRALGLGLLVRDVRGNVDTRLRLVTAGTLDAVVLARAGLARLGRLDAVAETLDPLQMLPAPGQGALAVECRADRADVRAAVTPLDDLDSRVTVAAERALLGALEAGCTAPMGALAEVAEGEDGLELSLRAYVGSVDGSATLRRSLLGPVDAPEALGRRLAALLLADGAAALVRGDPADHHTSPPPPPAPLKTREPAS
ncbi:MAG: hydroxymethylbilane synthase [Dermatophilaceae bacterium]